MHPRLNFILILVLISKISAKTQMEGYIVGGDEVNIGKAPHSAFIEMACKTNSAVGWICGSSIINQQFLLTASHCVFECTSKGSILATVGNSHRHRGKHVPADKYKIHENYNDQTMANDIALVRLKYPLQLKDDVKRVILVPNVPSRLNTNVNAYVAGWGLKDEVHMVSSNFLKFAKQQLWSKEECRKKLGRLAEGAICAGIKQGHGYAAMGDSGSALMIDNYIQIGIVSFKIPKISKNLIVYSDVCHYHNWIATHTARVYCGR